MRRYDLDWLRVIVFALLIFYHVGMFFVPWGWHIKNNELSHSLIWPMLFLNQWRLPILFIISGMGTAFALSFRNGTEFRIERLKRLGIPLLFGCLFIIPPQVYIERFANGGFSGSYLDFWAGPYFNGIYPTGNFSWHHLWFLPYLLVYSLLLSPVFLYLRDRPHASLLNWLRKILDKNPLSIYFFVIPLYFYEALLEPFFPSTKNLVYDWFNFTSSMTLFFYGFVLISVKEQFWMTVSKIKNTALIIGIFTFGGQVTIWLFLKDSIGVHFTEAALKVVNLWSWILTIFGYASQYLNKPSEVLKYCNQAVYPFYILHQTITIIIGFYLMDLAWGVWPKFALMVLGTFGFTWIIYHFLISQIRFLKPLFGLKS